MLGVIICKFVLSTETMNLPLTCEYCSLSFCDFYVTYSSKFAELIKLCWVPLNCVTAVEGWSLPRASSPAAHSHLPGPWSYVPIHREFCNLRSSVFANFDRLYPVRLRRL